MLIPIQAAISDRIRTCLGQHFSSGHLGKDKAPLSAITLSMSNRKNREQSFKSQVRAPLADHSRACVPDADSTGITACFPKQENPRHSYSESAHVGSEHHFHFCHGPAGTSRSSTNRHCTRLPLLKLRKSLTAGLKSIPAEWLIFFLGA